ncbi:hypothetical protein GH714_019307 [Hevea brasiliensis]|uniref:MACPF domain-containing protein n=1 Tax=Hevea brasiliensis TaxID=3981 RepID=A0A6A6M2G7_HEVBR|nr:hypothetical protein GH714_019307 [Hevea brasiliensis]
MRMGENAIGNAAALHTAMNSVQALGEGSIDINKTSDPKIRQSSGVLTFYEMVEYFNQKADISGGYPLGSFNSAFSFTGSKHIDAASTKTLSMDGFYIPLAKIQLMKSPLVLQDNVKQAVPNFWDPSSLASFIENFGTHVITSVTIGGKDMIYVKQHQSSLLSTMEVKNYVQDIGNQRFFDTESHTSSGPMKIKDKASPEYFFDVTIIFRRRGGDDLEQNHSRWERTVKSSPDVIDMTFVPITDLLNGAPGKEHLTRAIGLYLEYKPPIEELRYFLEFQIPQIWAPVQENIPGHQRKEPVCPSLQFSMMGPKLYVSQEQVSVGKKPVTGMRLSLEGAKQNRLSIHIQHLASLPKILLPYWDTHVSIGAPKWQGPEEQDSDGAQLGVWDFGSRNVLYMKFLYSRLPGCTIRRSLWDHAPDDKSKKVPSVKNTNAGDSSSGSTENTLGKKLAKFVDMSEMSKGPQDPPGHWLVTGGKLSVEKGAMCGAYS